jgi:hypothetical protein
VEVHPAELLLDKSGRTLFVFVSTASKVQVVDTKKRQLVSTWSVSGQRNGDGALDEKTHRLFIGTRTPARMIAMDSRTGKEVANLPTVEGSDDVYFDAAHKRVYVSGGRDNDAGSPWPNQRCQNVTGRRMQRWQCGERLRYADSSRPPTGIVWPQSVPQGMADGQAAQQQSVNNF